MPKKKLKKSSRSKTKSVDKSLKVFKKVTKKNKTKKYHKKALRPETGLMLIGITIIIFSVWFMFRSTDLVNNTYNETTRNASSMLAYDTSQIRTAKIVGPDKQLKIEIINYYKAPKDLQNFVLNDYRNLKKDCVKNGDLVGQANYKIVTVAYSGFAIISKGCNGEEDNIYAKFSNHWASIFRGNDLIPCSLVNDYDIPQTISRYCQTNSTTFLNPNP